MSGKAGPLVQELHDCKHFRIQLLSTIWYKMLPLVFHKSCRRNRHHQRASSRSMKVHLCTIVGKPPLQRRQTRGRPRTWNHTELPRTLHSKSQPETGSQVRRQPSDNPVRWNKRTWRWPHKSGEGSRQSLLSCIPQT